MLKSLIQWRGDKEEPLTLQGLRLALSGSSITVGGDESGKTMILKESLV